MCLFPFSLKSKYSDLVKDDFLRNTLLLRGEILLPCGHCIECQKERAKEWSFRICLEAQQYPDNSFITLTYNNEHCDGYLHKKDVQLFIKRLRKKVYPRKIRVFYCGEYGSKGLRPHYHIIVFNYCPSDLVYLKTTKKGEKIFRSAEISDLWGKGFISVGEVTPDSAKYCAKYMQKFQKLSPEYPPPFIQMSNRPGIGYNSINFNILLTDKIYLGGHYIKTPRYFIKVLERNGVDLTKLKEDRLKKSLNFLDSFDGSIILDKRRSQSEFIGENFDQ